MATKILIIAANPWGTKRLALDEEYREITNIWKQSKQRDQFILEYAPAARDNELRQALLDFEPNIVHFSGHGELDGLFFLDKEGNSQQIGTQALTDFFALFSEQVNCVVLNACYSEEQAQSISKIIDNVIGMNTAIGDQAAIQFATGFYQALFNGKNISFAHKFACNAIDLVNIAERDTPVLMIKSPEAQTQLKSYLTDYQYDVLVHVSDKEKEWATTFVKRLEKYLLQLFPQGIRICLRSDSDLIFTDAATTLLLLSPHYLADYAEILETVSPIVKQQCLFLADYQPTERAHVLNGLLSYCFWQADPKKGLCSLSPADHDYSLQIENIAEDIKKRLNALFQQQLMKKSLQSLSLPLSGTAADSVVFVNVAAEDRTLARQVQQRLNNKGIATTLPIDQSLNPPPSDIRRDIEINLLNCDAVLVIYGESSPLWVKEQLLICHRWQRKREEPLKVIAVHNEQYESNSELPDVHLPNLQVFYCPPDIIDDYLIRFVEALK